MSEDRNALAEALDYFRPHPMSRDQASIVLTVGKMREHLAVIEAALRGDAGAEMRGRIQPESDASSQRELSDEERTAKATALADAHRRALPLTPTEDGRDAL